MFSDGVTVVSDTSYHVCPSSKARNELELLGAGKSCTGVSDPTNKGFPFVPERFDLSSEKKRKERMTSRRHVKLSLILLHL